ncbi:MAG TPA: S1 RNA-binding domain-containing protein, partial [Chitinophagaceae bacterium]|nr:S1 RNA-binding domain-containing protein [Chitinophagaceae bacterium]
SMLGPKAFEQCAGFLRIPGGLHPLDNSAVHPESYPLVERMAGQLGCTVEDIIREPEIRRRIRVRDFVSETAGEYTIADIMKELEKPGRDPRSPIEEFRYAEGISSVEDLRPGMKLPGIVTNVTNFGAFVDIGVKQDGLVHISHLSNRYVSDPAQVVKLNDKVQVTVLEVDVARKRIALSMKESAGGQDSQASRGPSRQRAGSPRPGAKPAAPQNAFQAKLDELKKKFRD